MATSYEPSRTSAYSEDMRWRMVWQVEGLGCTHIQVAKNVGVDRSTVSRTIQLFHVTGSVSKRIYPKEQAFRKLTAPVQLLILHLVMQKPGIYLREIQNELSTTLLVQVDVGTICRFLHNSGFTRQKLKIVALQRDEFLRQQFIVDVSVYNTDMLVFIDETGADRRNLLRRHGYSLRGMPLVKQAMLVRGEHLSGMAVMSVHGLLDVRVTKGGTNGDDFYDFIQDHVLCHLQPFNGITPHSVIILDNCAIHHTHEVVDMIEGVGAIIQFLPPYSPDLNPIEEAFSKVKSEMKNLGETVDITDTETIIFY